MRKGRISTTKDVLYKAADSLPVEDKQLDRSLTL